MAKTKFKELLGSSQEIKVLELLIEGRDFEYTLNDIVIGAGINRNKAYKLLKRFIKLNFIVETKKIKNFVFYKINKQKKEIRLLIQIYDTI